MAKVKKPRKKVTGYQMPDPLPEGEILSDSAKKQWKLGPSIAKGGFGEIYAAKELASKASKYPFVVKVEPHGNGPLFVEMHFYVKHAKLADIQEFMKKRKLKTFGMPVYYGSGSHEMGGTKFRFIVMERFGADVDKLRKDNHGALPVGTVFQLAWQITYVLEYIHELGFVHADIKGGNVLLGTSPETKNQSYLLDFGLVTKYSTEKDFKPNPKRAHDGTIEYVSRDAHQGVPTRRGDFEILAYNLIHWLGAPLPWDNKLADPKIVYKMKEESLSDIPKFVKKCLKTKNDTIVKFLQYVDSLEFSAKPDYNKIRSLFEKEIEKNGGTVKSRLELTSARKRRSFADLLTDGDKTGEESEPEAKKPARRRAKQKNEENVKVEVRKSDEDSEPEVKKPARRRAKQKEEDVEVEVRNPRRRYKKRVETDSEDSEPEVVIKASRRRQKQEDDVEMEVKKPARKREPKTKEITNGSEEVMTQAMREVLERKKEKDLEKKKKTQRKKANGDGK